MAQGRKPTIKLEQIIQIRELHQTLRPFEIAKITGVPSQTVRYYIRGREDRKAKAVSKPAYQCNGIFNVEEYSKSTYTL